MNREIEAMISSYLDDELSEQDKIKFENYMNNNIQFSNKVHIVRNMIDKLNHQPILSTSDNFVGNLQSKIVELSDNSLVKSNKWFNFDFKTTFGYSLLILCISVFFINRSILSEKESIITNDYDGLNDNESLLSESDSLKIDDNQFPIHHVKGSSNNK